MRKRIISALLALICAVMTFALPVTAAERELDEGNTDLTLHYYIKDQKRAMSDVIFCLYKVGDYVSGPVSGIYSFKATQDFEDSNVDLTDLNFRTGIDGLTDLVNALVPYTEMNKETVEPMATDKTDSSGSLTFKNLGPGLYLVWGETSEITESDGNGKIREWKYTPQAFLTPLPYPARDGSFNHEVKVTVKYEQFPPPTAEYIDITVRKKWEPEGKSHPDSVVVVLLRNGELTDDGEITLNAGNGWTHTWTDLDPTIRWEVAEKDIPDGYTVSVNRDGYYFTVTNKSTEPDDPPPSPEDDPTPTPSEDPADPDSPPIFSDMSDNTDISSLPQTGQLWWPVPLLVAVGVPLLLIGASLFVRKEEGEKFGEPYE